MKIDDMKDVLVMKAEEKMNSRIKDDNIYYQDKKGNILSEDEWIKAFNSHISPCKWYDCCGPFEPEQDNACEHPHHFCLVASGLKEVRHYGLDEDGSLMWEDV